jgi:hypothetical protein
MYLPRYRRRERYKRSGGEISQEIDGGQDKMRQLLLFWIGGGALHTLIGQTGTEPRQRQPTNPR